MKIYAVIFVFVFAFQTSVKAQKETSKKKSITVKIPNVTSNKGTVKFALYNKETFMKKPLQALYAKIVDKKCSITFKGIDSGEYAIVCFHDVNDNNQIDFDANNIMPVEDYGVSNNPMNYGPPQYSDAKFQVSDKDVTLEIKF